MHIVGNCEDTDHRDHDLISAANALFFFFFTFYSGGKQVNGRQKKTIFSVENSSSLFRLQRGLWTRSRRMYCCSLSDKSVDSVMPKTELRSFTWLTKFPRLALIFNLLQQTLLLWWLPVDFCHLQCTAAMTVTGLSLLYVVLPWFSGFPLQRIPSLPRCMIFGSVSRRADMAKLETLGIWQ